MKKLTDLKTFEDACMVEKLDPKKVIPDFSLFPKADREAMIAHAKLIIINMAANRIANKGKAWKADWDKPSQYKYYPWFYMGGSGGFRFDDCGCWDSLSFVGSRLCFISYEVAEYVGQQFIDLYKSYFVK